MTAVPRHRVLRLALWGAASPVLWAGAAQADEALTLQASRDYVVGAAIVSSAGQIGESDQRLSLSPVWAFQIGRFRLASGPAANLLSVGREKVDAGLSTVLVSQGAWRLSTSLRIRDARDSADDPLLQGLPDVRATLLGRVNASVDLGSRWSGSLSATQDLLGRGTGLGLGAGLGYRYPLSASTYWDASVGLGWGNALAHRTNFGISPEAAASSGRAPYAIGAGWDSASLGWNLTSALSERWVAYGGLGVSQLQGAAARSPLVGRRTVASASIGLAYRGRH
ncbi:MipA/OmpV family protein [Hydrogenophaga sp.]|uniref:MipA/OmpV family protein n=1 Tax=Hydrogenophaga sp. TaxID=1904254 RepID=UPI00286E0E9E|nr:MipA/OmpV family protein [Hydrogenophaga sp.]